MIIYRAMCKEELEKTLRHQKPDFHKRFKWFSQNLEWVENRVRDGVFNNSNFKKDRYRHLVEFEWVAGKCDFQSRNEIQFDRRKNAKIKFLRVLR